MDTSLKRTLFSGSEGVRLQEVRLYSYAMVVLGVCCQEQGGREYFLIVECYKTVFALNVLKFDDFFEFNKCKMEGANHNFKLRTKLAKCSCYKYSFLYKKCETME